MSVPTPRDTRLFDAGATWATEPSDRRGYGDALREAVERATTPGDRDRGRELAELAASWDANAAEERRAMGRPSVSVDEAVSGPYVADTWEQAASELRSALAAPAETEAGDDPDAETWCRDLPGNWRIAYELAARSVMRPPNSEEVDRWVSSAAHVLDAIAAIRAGTAAASPPAPESEAAAGVVIAIRREIVEQLDGIERSTGPSTEGMKRALTWAVGMVDRLTASPPAPGEGQGATEGGDNRG